MLPPNQPPASRPRLKPERCETARRPMDPAQRLARFGPVRPMVHEPSWLERLLFF